MLLRLGPGPPAYRGGCALRTCQSGSLPLWRGRDKRKGHILRPQDDVSLCSAGWMPNWLGVSGVQ